MTDAALINSNEYKPRDFIDTGINALRCAYKSFEFLNRIHVDFYVTSPDRQPMEKLIR